MYESLIPRPFGTDRDYFAGILERFLAADRLVDVFAGGRTPGDRLAVDGRELVLPFPRLTMVTEGAQRFAFSHHGQRVDVVLEPGQVLYAPPSAWTIEYWDRPATAFGVVFRPHVMRALVYQVTPNAQFVEMGTPYSYHTSRPLAGPAYGIMEAMNGLAETTPSSKALRGLLHGLLHVALDHLRHDDPLESRGLSRSALTWQQVVDYLHDHYMEPISRQTVASALGMHPNYLSALARQQTQRGFQAVLEDMRLKVAKRLLTETDVKLVRIANLSGYQSASYFSVAFRRQTGYSPSQYRIATRCTHQSPTPRTRDQVP